MSDSANPPCRLSELVFRRIEIRSHLPVFHEPPRRDGEDAAAAVAVPVGHALVGPHHALQKRKAFVPA